MIEQVETFANERIKMVRVVLSSGVGKYDYGPAISAVFGLEQCEQFRYYLLSEACRGVIANRLTHVLANGIDVEPSDAPIWVSSCSKAAEYGDWPKLILILDPIKLDRTFRKLPDTSSCAERAAMRPLFPTETRSPDGKNLWFSRLRADDCRLATDYEITYGRWIPGDARDALIGLIVMEHPLYGEAIRWDDVRAKFFRTQ